MTEPKPWLRELEIEIEAEKVKEKIDRTVEQLLDQAEIPGFRKGRVPRHIIVSRFGTEVESQTAADLIKEAYDSAIEEKHLHPIRAGEVKDYELTADKRIRFKIEFEVIPEFELKSYTSIRIERHEPTGFDAEFDRRLNALRERLATYTPLSRPSQNGDFLLVDYTTTRFDSLGDAVGKQTDKRSNIMLHVGDTENFAELNRQLAGLNPGDEKDVSVRLPDDYADKELAGKTLVYHFGVRAVKEKHLPELDDEFAKNLGFENLDGLRVWLNDEITADREKDIESDLLNQIHNWLIDQHQFAVPPSFVEEVYQQLLAQIQAPETPEMKERVMPIAEKKARFQVVIARIAEKENIEVTDEERDKVLDDYLAHTKTPPAEIEKLRERESFRYRLLEEKVMRFLLGKAAVAGKPAAKPVLADAPLSVNPSE
jgi:trigger factor